MRDKTKDWAIGFTFFDDRHKRLECQKEVQYKCAPYAQGDGSEETYFIFEDQFENEFSTNEFMKVFNEAGILITYDKKTDVARGRSIFHGDTHRLIKSRSYINANSDGVFGFLLTIEV